MNFFVGLHQPSDAARFDRCMINVARLARRVSDFRVGEWVMDSGAFQQVSRHGRFLMDVEEYARQIRRWSRCGSLLAAVSQDWMCEPFVLEKTGLATEEHQRRTVDRYVQLWEAVGGDAYVMPVLQGYWPEEYVGHLGQYGGLLRPGMWVGVGSVCKRNVDIESVEHVLVAVRKARPDLRLHGFGVKLTALGSSVVRDCLWSADSMAWSYSARMQGRDGNSWLEARSFAARIEAQEVRRREYQPTLFG